MLKSLFRKAGNFLIGLSEASKNADARDNVRQRDDKARRLAAGDGDHRPQFLAGSIHFLNLDQIRRELGANWDRASVAAYEIVQQTIERNLHAGDTYARQGCDMFVLCFASHNREAVEARMRGIETEIRWALTKSQNETFRVAYDVADLHFVDLAGTPVMDTVAATLRKVREESEKAARAWRENLMRNAGVRYRPIWSPRKKVVALHRTMLDEETGRRTIDRLNGLASIEDRLDLLFDLDCLILGRATAGLHDLLSRGGRSQLIVPVNFNTLNSKPKRLRYLKLCEDIPTAFRRFLLFEISNIPPGTPGARITEVAVPLNAYAHGTFIEAAVGSANSMLDGSGSAIVGVALHADHFAHSPELQARLKRFVTQSIARNLKVLIDGVDNEACLRTALAAGVDCLAGPSVAETSRTLRTVYHWDLGKVAA